MHKPNISAYSVHPSVETMSSGVRYWVCLLAIGVFLLGTTNLIGWWLDISAFKSVLPGLASLKVNAAVSMILCSISLFFLTRPLTFNTRLISACCAMLVAIIGLVTIAEYLFGWDAGGFDQWLFKEPLGMSFTASPGRMALIAAVIFSLMSCSLLLMNLQRHWHAIQCMALSSALISLMPIIGYMFGNLILFKFGQSSGIAAHASLGLLACSIGILLASVQHGFMLKLQPILRQISLSIAIALLLVSVAAMFYNNNQNQQAIRHVEQTYALIKEMQATATDLYEHKAQNRSFLLTGNKKWLDQANKTRQELRASAALLKEILRDHPDTYDEIQHFDKQLEKLFNSADQLIRIRNEQGIGAVAAKVSEGETDMLHADLVRQIELEISKALQVLQLRKETVALKAAISSVTQVGMLAIGLGLLLITFIRLRREVNLRKAAEQKLLATLEASPVSQLLNDEHGNITYTNRAFSKLIGYQLQDIPSLSQWWELACHTRQLKPNHLKSIW